MKTPLVEVVPNFSEGRDMTIIQRITDCIESVDGVTLLDVDPGKATNRTVVTFVGTPDAAVEAAYLAIKKAAELIDMRRHKGEHPRFGATDVCPFIPVRDLSMEEAADCARQLGKRLGELGIPVYLYESAATEPKRRNLATVRAGEYEGIKEKIRKPEWKPDFGPAEFNERTGNIAVGARDFLVAYNVNLNTTSTRRANNVAFDIREAGRVKTEDGSPTGKKVLDANGQPIRIPGTCKSVKGIGWYIEEYGVAQVSMNLTNLKDTPLHKAFHECNESAHRRGMRVTGSELVGLVPLQAMLDAGKYFLTMQERSVGVPDSELIKIAVKSMGLDELTPFDPKEKIIEYKLAQDQRNLVDMSLRGFADETSCESPAPGGGSVAAYAGALGASLAGMVANLSAHKRGWEDRWEEFSQHAAEGQRLKDKLLQLVDADTAAFNGIMAAFRLPKGNDAEKAARKAAIEAATIHATQIPFEVVKTCVECFALCKSMAESGNPNSVSDAGVGALMARAGARGAALNVQINAGDIADAKFRDNILAETDALIAAAEKAEDEVMRIVHGVMQG